MTEPQVTAVATSDPVTLQIVANALQSIADEMATTIIRTAHSTVVRDGMKARRWKLVMSRIISERSAPSVPIGKCPYG